MQSIKVKYHTLDEIILHIEVNLYINTIFTLHIRTGRPDQSVDADQTLQNVTAD